jgi:hypothetical protein
MRLTRRRNRALMGGILALSITLGGCSMTPASDTPLADYQAETEQLAQSLFEMIPEAEIDSRSGVESDSGLATDGYDEWPKYWRWHGDVYLRPDSELAPSEAAETIGEALIDDGWEQSPSALSRDTRTVTEYRRDGWFLNVEAQLQAPPKAQAVRLTVISPATDH